jgi:hypothetical protein
MLKNCWLGIKKNHSLTNSLSVKAVFWNVPVFGFLCTQNINILPDNLSFSLSYLFLSGLLFIILHIRTKVNLKYDVFYIIIELCVFNATFKKSSVISWVSFVVGEDQSIMRTPPTCCTSLTTFITSSRPKYHENTTDLPHVTHNLYHINLSSTQRKPPTCLNSQPLSHQSIECTYKIINLLQLTDKLYHFNLDIKRYALNQNRTHNCCGERHWK